MMSMRWLLTMSLMVSVGTACADGPADNQPDKVRRIPPDGVAVPDADRAELKTGCEELAKEIESLRAGLNGKPALLDLLPDVEVYHKAVWWALSYNEFFDKEVAREVQKARTLLKQGMDRAKQ